MIHENVVPYEVSGLMWQDPTDWSTETTDGVWYAEEQNGKWMLRKWGKPMLLYPTKRHAQRIVAKFVAAALPK